MRSCFYQRLAAPHLTSVGLLWTGRLCWLQRQELSLTWKGSLLTFQALSSATTLNEGGKNLSFLTCRACTASAELALWSKSSWSSQPQDILDPLMLLLMRWGSRPAFHSTCRSSVGPKVPMNILRHSENNGSPSRCWLGLGKIQTWYCSTLSMPT